MVINMVLSDDEVIYLRDAIEAAVEQDRQDRDTDQARIDTRQPEGNLLVDLQLEIAVLDVAITAGEVLLQQIEKAVNSRAG